jgi:hypothetical protein
MLSALVSYKPNMVLVLPRYVNGVESLSYNAVTGYDEAKIAEYFIGKIAVLDLHSFTRCRGTVDKLLKVADRVIIAMTSLPTINELNYFLGADFNVRKLPNILRREQLLEAQSMLSTEQYSREFVVDFRGLD